MCYYTSGLLGLKIYGLGELGLKKGVAAIIVCALMLVCLSGCNGGDSFRQGFQDGMNNVNEEINEVNVDDTEQPPTATEKSEVNSTEEIAPIEKNIENVESEANTEEGEGIRNENLNGRGRADSGRSEPQYVNMIGYVVVGYDQSYELEHTDNFEDTDLWVIPTYEQDKQFWNDKGVLIPHKTEVIVREQILSHEGYGAYSGYLLVESLEDGEQYYINVSNFVTKPYWTYSDDLRSAALTGDFIAVYHQVSDYYPVTNGGDKAEIEDGKVVLVKGVAGLSRNVDPDETGIDAVVWQEWRLGYGDVTVHFNAEDLTIIY